MFLDKARCSGGSGESTDVALGGASGAVGYRPYYDFATGMRNDKDAVCILTACLGEFVRTSDNRCADGTPVLAIQVSIVQVVGALI